MGLDVNRRFGSVEVAKREKRLVGWYRYTTKTPGYENDRVLRPCLVLSNPVKAPDLEWIRFRRRPRHKGVRGTSGIVDGD